MNKTDFIASVASRAEISKAEATRVVEAVLTTITTTLCEGDDVRLPGFGTFSVSERAETKGRNPATGAEMLIPARRVARFAAGKNLKDAVQK